MKSSLVRILVLVTLVMGVCVAQNASAETISGTITEISTKPNIIVIDDTTEIYGVKLNYLANQYNVVLEEGDEVSVDTYTFECSDGSIKDKATAITVGDITIQLR